MNRKLIRKRQEYLYRKNLEGPEKIAYERKTALRKALEKGESIPNELRADGLAIFDSLDAEDAETQRLAVADEYADVVSEPKVLITTSRSPSARLSKFVSEIKLVIPNSVSINRGGMLMADIVSSCRKNDFTDLILIHENRGVPDTLIISHLPNGPTASFTIKNCSLRHDKKGDLGRMTTVAPRLIFDGFGGKVGARVVKILGSVFPVPKEASKRVVTFANRDDLISFRNHTFEKISHNTIDLKEIGPRFELKLFQIAQATIEQKLPKLEWVLRPYMNTAKKRRVLSKKSKFGQFSLFSSIKRVPLIF